MTLRSRAFLLLAAAVTAALITGISVQWVFSSVRDNQLRTIGQLYPASDNVSELLVATSDMESGVDGYVITGDPASLTPFVLGRARAERAGALLRTHLQAGAPDLLPLLDQIDSNTQRWLAVAAEPQIALVRAGDNIAAQAAITQGVGKRSYTSLRSDLAVLSDQLDRRVVSGAAEIARVSNWLSQAMFATALATITILAASTWAMNAWVLRPLGDLRAQMRRLTEDEDRNTALVPSGPPEVSALGQDAEDLRRSLVSATDKSIAAGEGLAQEGPLVSSLQSYLEGPSAVSVPGYEVASASLSAEGVVTGDWWTMITDGPFPHVVVADVSGHGVPAARVAVQMKALMRIALPQDRPFTATLDDLTYLFGDEPATFASAVVVALDSQEIRYLNAGHLAPLLCQRAPSAVQELAPTGPIISAIAGTWTVRSAHMAPGDFLVLYTDGLVEGRNAAGEQVDEALLFSWVEQCTRDSANLPAPRAARSIASGLLDRARAYSADLRRDDVTVVVAVRV